VSPANTYLGFIPARAGSVRVSRKNVRPFADVNLVEIAVTAACAAQRLHGVVVSTDSSEILECSQSAGYDGTYLRPPELAGAESAVADCVQHYLEWSNNAGGASVSHIVLLQPTSPFRSAQHIDQAIESMEAAGKNSLVSVTSIAPRPELYLRRDRKTGVLRQGSQEDRSDVYALDGEIYVSPISMIRGQGRFWDSESALFVSERPRYFDIDSETDFAVAETLYVRGQGSALGFVI